MAVFFGLMMALGPAEGSLAVAVDAASWSGICSLGICSACAALSTRARVLLNAACGLLRQTGLVPDPGRARIAPFARAHHGSSCGSAKISYLAATLRTPAFCVAAQIRATLPRVLIDSGERVV